MQNNVLCTALGTTGVGGGMRGAAGSGQTAVSAAVSVPTAAALWHKQMAGVLCGGLFVLHNKVLPNRAVGRWKENEKKKLEEGDQ